MKNFCSQHNPIPPDTLPYPVGQGGILSDRVGYPAGQKGIPPDRVGYPAGQGKRSSRTIPSSSVCIFQNSLTPLPQPPASMTRFSTKSFHHQKTKFCPLKRLLLDTQLSVQRNPFEDNQKSSFCFYMMQYILQLFSPLFSQK